MDEGRAVSAVVRDVLAEEETNVLQCQSSPSWYVASGGEIAETIRRRVLECGSEGMRIVAGHGKR